MRAGYVVHVSPAQVEPFIDALRNNALGQSGQFNVGEWRGYPEDTFTTGPASYEAALDDARQKASVIAARLGERLGSVESVTEYSGGVAASSVAPGAPVMRPINAVSATDRVVTLAVMYRTQSADSIAVFGRGDAAQGAPEGVSIDVYTSAPSEPEARDRMQRARSYIYDTAHAFHVPDSAIAITSAGFGGP